MSKSALYGVDVLGSFFDDLSKAGTSLWDDATSVTHTVTTTVSDAVSNPAPTPNKKLPLRLNKLNNLVPVNQTSNAPTTTDKVITASVLADLLLGSDVRGNGVVRPKGVPSDATVWDETGWWSRDKVVPQDVFKEAIGSFWSDLDKNNPLDWGDAANIGRVLATTGGAVANAYYPGTGTIASNIALETIDQAQGKQPSQFSKAMAATAKDSENFGKKPDSKAPNAQLEAMKMQYAAQVKAAQEKANKKDYNSWILPVIATVGGVSLLGLVYMLARRG